ncbi:NUDIX hydrolase [Halalkalibacter okhensis]|uniref:NUDIX hydrolase n=1 Tax=Halalkalibacter okhensis TaxID=333138 RepID=A0A0B0IPI1_9BACI|nr:CoA pyrophosphatase [Halalkalibacter okhensis]KHF41959.1 NUDIX hydrolase [Halalkalibacter okhensis]
MNELSAIKRQLSNRKSGILGSGTMQSAVLLPLVYVNNELSILFEVRSKTLAKQPGEICFPGGKIDPTDPTPEAAAIRELTEEIGIPENKIKMIAPLDKLVTPFRGIIYPFIGELLCLDELNINHDEVDHTFTVPLSYLYEHEPDVHSMKLWFEPGADFPIDKVPNKHAYSNRYNEISEHFYYYHEYVIWGLTARILNHFLDITKPS